MLGCKVREFKPLTGICLKDLAPEDNFYSHVNMISGWEEFKQFTSTKKPVDMRVYGQLSAEAAARVRQFVVVSKTFDEHVAGFVRG